jgi:hypothetical protein
MSVRHVTVAHSACDHAIAESERVQHERAEAIATSLLTSSSWVVHHSSIYPNVIFAGSLDATAYPAQLSHGHGRGTLPLRPAEAFYTLLKAAGHSTADRNYKSLTFKRKDHVKRAFETMVALTPSPGGFGGRAPDWARNTHYAESVARRAKIGWRMASVPKWTK